LRARELALGQFALVEGEQGFEVDEVSAFEEKSVEVDVATSREILDELSSRAFLEQGLSRAAES
jgi:hypothetical protein